MKNVILFFLIFFACGKQDVLLQRCWTLSERGEDFQTYYPCGDERLQPARFSPVYEFYNDKKCRYKVLSSNDAHNFKDGTYDYNVQKSTVDVMNLEGELVAQFKILEITDEQLKVKEL
jgi:hypothetical protein